MHEQNKNSDRNRVRTTKIIDLKNTKTKLNNLTESFKKQTSPHRKKQISDLEDRTIEIIHSKE